MFPATPRVAQVTEIVGPAALFKTTVMPSHRPLPPAPEVPRGEHDVGADQGSCDEIPKEGRQSRIGKVDRDCVGHAGENKHHAEAVALHHPGA